MTISTLLYFLGAITTFLVEGNLEHVFWRRRMKKAIDELKEHFIVCGDRIVAAHVIDELRRVQRPVVAVVPEGVRRLIANKIEVAVASGAGQAAWFSDDDYARAGARLQPHGIASALQEYGQSTWLPKLHRTRRLRPDQRLDDSLQRHR